jgi:AcrR family transcriptional regulator
MNHADKAQPTRSNAASRHPPANDGRGPAPNLSRERIIRSAITLLDSEGLSGLSMRRLADHLDAGAMSLYWYFSTKDELLRAATDTVLGEIRLEDLPDDWRAAVRAIASDLRATIQRHPWLRQMLSTVPATGPHGLGVMESMLTTLSQAGLREQQLDFAATTILGYVFGFAVAENAWTNTFRAATPDVLTTAAGTMADYPFVVSFLTDAAAVDPYLRFVTGINLILAGVMVVVPD